MPTVKQGMVLWSWLFMSLAIRHFFLATEKEKQTPLESGAAKTTNIFRIWKEAGTLR